jgi:ferredoxin-type protein NapG
MADDARRFGRRKFMQDCIGLAGSASVIGLLLGTYSGQSKALPAWALRPPGALPEDRFGAACVRCGLCVRACPFDMLRLAELGEDIATGTPFFVARDIACEMCEDIPCAAACPTDALSKELKDIRDARMGVAVLTGRDTCYAVARGANCRACYLACPIKDEAITMERRHANGRSYFEPTVHADKCTGCGKCEHDCVTAEASIKVLPLDLAQRDRVLPG